MKHYFWHWVLKEFFSPNSDHLSMGGDFVMGFIWLTTHVSEGFVVETLQVVDDQKVAGVQLLAIGVHPTIEHISSGIFVPEQKSVKYLRDIKSVKNV